MAASGVEQASGAADGSGARGASVDDPIIGSFEYEWTWIIKSLSSPKIIASLYSPYALSSPYSLPSSPSLSSSIPLPPHTSISSYHSMNSHNMRDVVRVKRVIASQ
jgi:hypothetical protein